MAKKKSGIPSLADWLSSDPTYLATQAGLAKSQTMNDADRQKEITDYGNTYRTDLSRLGYQNGVWNHTDPLTTSGKAFGDQNADFASRGMLQSSGFADQQNLLGRNLNQQVSTAATARQKYDSDIAAQGSADHQANNESLIQAKLEAIARRSAKYATSASGALS